MKKCLLLALFSFLGFSASLGQVSPYTLSPKWMFGYYAGLDFSGGSPVFLNGNKTETAEATTTVCDPTGAMVLYSPSSSIWTPSGATASLGCGSVGGNSSTDGSVAFPVPGDATFNSYFFVTSTDNTGGRCGGAGDGLEYMIATRSGATLSFTGKTKLALSSEVNEALCVGSDRSGGYWVASHAQNDQIWVWHFTSSSAPSVSKITVPASVTLGFSITGGSSNGSIKFSKCQDKIGWYSNGYVQIYNWDNKNGTLGSEIISKAATSTVNYGFEFSPDGSKAYYTALVSPSLNQIDLSSPFTVTNLSTTSSNNSAELGTMQLGPDGKIYVVNGAFYPTSCNLGVIGTPNVAAGGSGYSATGFTMPTTAAPNGFAPFTYRGIANIAWLSPQVPVITPAATATCNVYNFTYAFNNYFTNNIGVTPGSEIWNFGDGTGNLTGLGATPSHTFPAGSGGPYTVNLTFKDATCGQDWTATIPVTVTCPAPVELISFNGVANLGGADLVWKTAMELNNDYFDLQRSSDGIHFTSIAHIIGAGTSNSTLTYSYRDTEVTSGLVYYKLAQHDYDGTISYSKIISVHFDKTGSAPILIAPNPFSSSFTVSKIFDEAATISVYDVLGRLLEQKTTSAAESTISLGESLVNGSYIVQYLTGSRTYTLHIEKK